MRAVQVCFASKLVALRSVGPPHGGSEVGRSAAAHGASSGELRIGCGGARRGPFHPTYLRIEPPPFESGGKNGMRVPAIRRPPLMPRGMAKRDIQPRPSGLGWRLSLRRPFEGDVAIKALCHRLSIDADFVPCPLTPQGRKPWLAWLGLAGLFAAVVTSGITVVPVSGLRSATAIVRAAQ